MYRASFMILARLPRIGIGILALLALSWTAAASGSIPCPQHLDVTPQERLLSLPWHSNQPPIIVPGLNVDGPLTLAQALTHQIVPHGATVAVLSTAESVAMGTGPFVLEQNFLHNPQIFWSKDSLPRLTGANRVAAVAAPGLLDLALLRPLRNNLQSYGAVAFIARKSELNTALAAVKNAGLTLVRLADHATPSSGKVVIVAMRVPSGLTERSYPSQKDARRQMKKRETRPLTTNRPVRQQSESYYNQRAAAWLKGRANGWLTASSGDYFRRDNGANVSAEMRRRYGIGDAAAPGGTLMQIDSLGGRPSVDLTEAGAPARATFMPEFGTLFIHHRDGFVPPGSRFIAIGLHGIGGERSNADSWKVNVTTITQMGGALIAPDSAAASLGPVEGDIDHYIRFLHRIVASLKARYNLPIVLLGRSFGSTLARELVRQHPEDAAVTFLASYSNPYTDELQTQEMIKQERAGLMTLFWPGMNLAEKLAKEFVARYTALGELPPVVDRKGRPTVYYMQGYHDLDGGPTVMQDLERFLGLHDPEMTLMRFDCDHFLFNPSRGQNHSEEHARVVRETILPWMERTIYERVLGQPRR